MYLAFSFPFLPFFLFFTALWTIHSFLDRSGNMSVISWLSCAGTVTFNTSPLPNANVWSAALGSRCEASSFHGYSGLRKVVASWGCSTSALFVEFSEVWNGTGVLIAFLLLVFEGGLFVTFLTKRCIWPLKLVCFHWNAIHSGYDSWPGGSFPSCSAPPFTMHASILNFAAILVVFLNCCV